MSEASLTGIEARLSLLRTALLEHPVYPEIHSLDKLHIFMQHHVFAVWDFMSLLKALQKAICGTELPWLPAKNPQAARFINEIVLGEESDEDGRGGFASHFELYRRAMRQAGADLAPVNQFLTTLQAGSDPESALQWSRVPGSIAAFVRQTFQIIEGGNLCEIAAAFTFGREELLPGVFQKIVESLNQETAGRLDDFLFYLNRHIELDHEEHGPMAAQLMQSLCGDSEDNWQRAEKAAVASLEARLMLWNGIHEAIQTQTPCATESASANRE